MNQPQIHEYPQWYKGYIDLVAFDVIDELDKQPSGFKNFILSNADKADFAYAEGKWTIKEVFGHINDVERVMAFRLLCFARGETASLPGFEEDVYVRNANFAALPLNDLCEEFIALRKANLFLIKSLSERDLDRKGIANGNEISVRALIFILAGHVIHHQNIIKERYL